MLGENTHVQSTLLDRQYKAQNIVQLVHDAVCEAWRLFWEKAWSSLDFQA